MVLLQEPVQSECRIITLWEPWATLMALGLKKYETRSWQTSYRGFLIIHAAKRPVKIQELRAIALALPQELGIGFEYLKTIEYSPGKIVAICNLTDCLEMTDSIEATKSNKINIREINSQEIAFGVWQPGRYAWKVSDLQKCIPCPFQGGQGLRKTTMPSLCFY